MLSFFYIYKCKGVRKVNIYIVAGGPSSLLPDLVDLFSRDHNKILVGVDRGALILSHEKMPFDHAFGDFDSVTTDDLAIIKTFAHTIHSYPPEKDQTDLELAINWSIRQNPQSICIVGATGGRLDHSLGNILLLTSDRWSDFSGEVTIIDCQNELTVKKPGTYQLERNGNKYISFLSLSEQVDELTLVNFKYPLQQFQLMRGETIGISNELISESGTFSFSKGILMVIRSRD